MKKSSSLFWEGEWSFSGPSYRFGKFFLLMDKNRSEGDAATPMEPSVPPT